LNHCFPIRLYAGYDPREEAGYHAFCASVIQHASAPVTIAPLGAQVVQRVYSGGQRDGTNAFNYLRFLIPFLQDFDGWAIFADGSDMVMRADIAQLAEFFDPYKAVQVVKHNYRTKHARKYVGTPMEAGNSDYPRKNWSSLMIVNCAHYRWREMTPEKVASMPGSWLHRFEFIEDERIGELPKEWNWLVDEFGDNADAKLLHWTAGIPGFTKYAEAPMAAEWFAAHARANATC
jgi:hypothetical protein